MDHPPVSTPRKAAPRSLRRARRGQAMVEYSVLNWVLLVALVVGATVKIRWSEDRQSNVIDLFLEAYEIYYDSFYFVLNLPFP
ncbi:MULTISPECIES: hypothetical protein [Corallococcus]|uniref:hypothetical protein n=1 Tax=Corallococcus TaxID=83461 RepID=UPI0011C3AA5E|nr:MULTISPECIES: hypothetical protein [Corallococcus]